MKDYSIFQGIKELRGTQGNFRIEGGHVYKKHGQDFIHVGYVHSGKYSNKALYNEACRLDEEVNNVTD